MRKPSFIVVSLTVLLLFLMGSTAMLVRPQIPPNQANPLANDPREFHRQAAGHRIDWMPLEKSSFALARRQSRMVLLYIGVSWSKFARNLDRYVFSDRRVASFLERNAVCIRVDGDEARPWLGAYFPLSRGAARFVPGGQVMILDSSGRLLDVFVKNSSRTGTEPESFMEVLYRCQAKIEERYEPEPGEFDPAATHSADVAALAGTTLGSVPDGDFGEGLSRAVHPAFGGYPYLGVQQVWPNALRHQLASGAVSDFERAILPMLRSGIVDWLDGGFFAMSNNVDWTELEYDKPAILNAEMLALLAHAYCATGKSIYKRLAHDTFRFLREGLTVDGWVRTARLGDELRLRSRSVSFSPRMLRDLRWQGLLRPEDFDFAVQSMGLRAESNPSMTIVVQDESVFSDARFERVLESLRRAPREHRPELASSVSVEVNGTVAARVMEAGQLLGSREMIEFGGSLFDRIQGFRTENDVFRDLRGSSGTLPDYLAFVDAGLADYIVNGRASSLELSHEVLMRAQFLFEDVNVAGTYLMSLQSLADFGPQDVAEVEVVEIVGESATAKMVRLQTTFERLMGAGTFGDSAKAAVTHWSPMLQRLGVPTSGFQLARLSLLDSAHAVAVGSDAVVLASELKCLVPARLVVPAVGPVRRDLQRRRPGVYLVRPGSVDGPYTAPEAAQLLPKTLSGLAQ